MMDVKTADFRIKTGVVILIYAAVLTAIDQLTSYKANHTIVVAFITLGSSLMALGRIFKAKES